MGVELKKEEVDVQAQYGKETILERNAFLENYHFSEQGLTAEQASQSIHTNRIK